jgi:hypothetical protein
MNLNPLESFKSENISPKFDLGEEVFSWEAHDYHPHKRGIIWYTVFCAILFGGAVWAMVSDPKWGWLMALSFFLAAAVYFLAHRKGDEMHKIKAFEQGIFIDKKFIATENVAGFWILYNETVSTVHLQLKSKYQNQKISLQMGNNSPEFFRKNFAKMNIPELEDAKETILDLWIRALKL